MANNRLENFDLGAHLANPKPYKLAYRTAHEPQALIPSTATTERDRDPTLSFEDKMLHVLHELAEEDGGIRLFLGHLGQVLHRSRLA